MIIGLGADLIDIRRIERAMVRFGDRFLARFFTTAERKRAEKSRADLHTHAAVYAKRFAAKEACAKALGTGFTAGVVGRDIGVVNDASGRPVLHLTGRAAHRLATLVPPGQVARINVTLSDDYPFAKAVVIISAVPDSGAAEAGRIVS
ncbi:MAG: Holo-acyl-carrier protein synthase [Rhodospirillaceae bacterium]|nr:MAG: Holo-acyl-carrier protein synthase [Rhodospirillaceae bacterium]